MKELKKLSDWVAQVNDRRSSESTDSKIKRLNRVLLKTPRLQLLLDDLDLQYPGFKVELIKSVKSALENTLTKYQIPTE